MDSALRWQKMSWKEVTRAYPNEWVAFVDYEVKDAIEVDGVVVVHNPERKLFHQKVKEVFSQYRDMAIRFTGPLIKNPDVPLLWQITDTV